MPKTLKKPAPPTQVSTRASRIRRAHEDGAAVPDVRDVAHDQLKTALAAKPTTTSLDISRAPERGQALELAQQLSSVKVFDRASYQSAKELHQAGKQVKQRITEHWQRVTRSIDALKKTIFGFRDDDLFALDAGLEQSQAVILAFENAENERVRLADEAQRAETERKAREQRQRELDASEDKALELEQQSANLSARELWFVTKVYENGVNIDTTDAPTTRALIAIAKQGGYKDADVQVARLLRSPKILDAIKAKIDAAAIREQAVARSQQPLNVIDAPPVESQIVRGRGLPSTKTYYSCEVLDANKLREAFLNGDLPAEALIPNEVYLNAQARAAKSAEIFERAFPGCRLKTRQSI